MRKSIGLWQVLPLIPCPWPTACWSDSGAKHGAVQMKKVATQRLRGWGSHLSYCTWVFPYMVAPPNLHPHSWSFLVGKPMGLLGKPIILGTPPHIYIASEGSHLSVGTSQKVRKGSARPTTTRHKKKTTSCQRFKKIVPNIYCRFFHLHGVKHVKMYWAMDGNGEEFQSPFSSRWSWCWVAAIGAAFG